MRQLSNSIVTSKKRDAVLAMLIGSCVLFSSGQCFAQSDEGFRHVVPATTNGVERARQNTLWVMEVQLKPMRLIWVDTRNAKTGKVEPELFHYVCYRAINRPVESPAARATQPKNRLDPEPGPAFFIPEFTLIPIDTDKRQFFLDEIKPSVVAAINRKERRKFKNSVTIVGGVPEATNEKPNNENALHGVAVFRGVDPQIDRFTLLMNGFSNGYEVVEGPNGEPLSKRKTIQQNIWRPGDKFDPESLEFRYDGDPQWIFRPDANPAAK